MRALAFASSLLLALLLLAPPAAAEGPCETPRTAVAHFLDNLQPDLYRPKLAIKCFDFSAGPATEAKRIRRARDLHAVLDGQGKYVAYDDVPGNADYTDPASGLPRVVLFPSLPEVRLERVDDEWKVAASTVALVPKLYDRTYLVPLERWAGRLPPALATQVVGVAAWKWLGVAILALLGLAVGRLLELALGGFFQRTARRFFESWNVESERAILRWSARLTAAGLVAALLPNLALPVRANQVLFVVVELAACVSAVLIVHAIVDFLADAMAKRAALTEATMDDALVPLLRRIAKLIVNLAGVLFVLQNLDVDIGSLLATLGLGGLAFALAAKDTLSNLFGFLTIVADRPFQIGDWVQIGDTEGTVEEVGIRSTRIRTFYDSLVTIPNSDVANTRVDNVGQRRRRRFKTHLSLAYDTTSAQMEAFVQGVRESIAATPKMADAPEVHFHQMSESSLDVLVYAFVVADTWSEELATRQSLMLRWMALADELGVEFAFPTRTLHVASMPEALAS